MKISDCINKQYIKQDVLEVKRSNVVLFNPTNIKLTRFQRTVMARATTELGVQFRPLEGYTRQELIDIFQHSKLYIDFGVFSGRERLPREAVMCGCCILTSDSGAARSFIDEPIPATYKVSEVDEAIAMINYVLHNYDRCKLDFNEYRKTLRYESVVLYPKEVKELANAILSYSPSV